MTNNNYNAQTDEQIARDILSILPDAPEDPDKEPTESPKVFMLPIKQLKSFQNHPFKIVDNDEMKDYALVSVRGDAGRDAAVC